VTKHVIDLSLWKISTINSIEEE